MPQPNDYLFQLKHRLVGAAVLLVVAIIILPLVLTGPKKSHRHALIGNRDAVVPIQQTFISRITVGSPDISVQQGSKDILTDDSIPRKQIDSEDSTKDVKNDGIDDNRTVKDSVGYSSGWVVRVGVFQIPENAKKRQSLLEENGFDVTLDETKLDGKAAIKIFLGPFSSEDEAERMKAQAMMVTNDKAFVVRYP